jgi:hypothetical protein
MTEQKPSTPPVEPARPSERLIKDSPKPIEKKG